MERVHAVEHEVAVLIRVPACDQELEAWLLLRGHVVFDAADSDFEYCTRVLEDGVEQLARLGG